MDDYWLRLAAVCVVGAGMLTGLWGVFRLMQMKGSAVSQGDDKGPIGPYPDDLLEMGFAR